jgi:hypothetical protein
VEKYYFPAIAPVDENPGENQHGTVVTPLPHRQKSFDRQGAIMGWMYTQQRFTAKLPRPREA